ncbi:MAG: M28 family peptidase [Candidatus Acidiferrales bacterium]
MKFRLTVVLCLGLALAPPPASGQSTPVIPDKVWDALNNELSGDIAFDHLRYLTVYHTPDGGAEDFRLMTEWVAAQAREVGLADVKVIWLPHYQRGWTLRSGEAWLLGPAERKLGDVRETPLRVATHSQTVDVTGELIDVGKGTADADYESKDVKGKIVLASGTAAAVQSQAVWKHGALGVISYASYRDGFPDQLPWQNLPQRSPDGKNESAFAWILTPREGERLKADLADAAKAESPKPAHVRVKIAAEWGEPVQAIVEGWLRGTEIRDQAIVLTAHLQEEKTSANDDRSGCANLLEIARALHALIAGGKLERPRRDIRFWWVNEISGPYRYFADHPEEAGRMLVNINQDMVGARQSAGARVQFLSRTPFSRPSFLNAVVESAFEAVRRGNTAYPLRLPGGTGDFSRPIVSALGTREPYRGEAVTFFTNTDHITFNDGRVGVPGVSLTNWPDPYIHSSDDDLWQMDATQLKRNAFIVAATAYYLARAGEKDAAALVSLLEDYARQRLAHAAASASLLLEGADANGPRYTDASLLLDETTRVELAALDSARALFSPDGSSAKLLNSARQRSETLAATLRAQLDAAYKERAGAVPTVKLSEEEKSAAKTVPEWTGPLSETMEKLRGQTSVAGIGSPYNFETRNLVDAKRSVLDIYRTVRAESLSAGEWYYGPVTLAKVREVLEKAEKAGTLRFRSR